MPYSIPWQRIALQFFLLLTVVIAVVPFTVSMPRPGLDPSWQYALNVALAHGFQFGEDIVFTFGPYGSIYTKLYHPETSTLMYLSSSMISLALGFVLLKNIKSLPDLYIVPISISIIFLVYSRDALFLFYVFNVGIYILRLMVDTSKENCLHRSQKLSLAVLLVVLSVFPLIKGTFLLVSFGIWSMASILAVLNREWRFLTLVLLLPIVSMVMFWVFAGQEIIGIFDYYRYMIPIISGYTEAMALEGDSKHVYGFCALAIIFVCIAVRNVDASYLVKTFSAIFLGVFAFVAFKAGFVRHDGHAILPALFLFCASLLLPSIIPAKRAMVPILLSLLFAIWIVPIYTGLGPIKAVHHAKTFYYQVYTAFATGSYNEEKLGARFVAAKEGLSEDVSLGEISGSVDIYSWDQAYLLAEDPEWNPRPVFQSYSAYTESLIKKNADHLTGNSAPSNIIFRLQSIDGRLPTMADGLSWLHILQDYELARVSPDYLLYTRTTEPVSGSNEQKKLVRSGVAQFGESVALPNEEGIFFLELDIEKTSMGNLASFIYKPSQLSMNVQYKEGRNQKFRVISGMTSTGFLISPLVENNEQMALLGNSFEMNSQNVVDSFTITAKDKEWVWSQAFKFRVYRLPKPKAAEIINSELSAEGLKDFSFNGDYQFTSTCIGSIDDVNGDVLPKEFKVANFLSVKGWMARGIDGYNSVDNPMLFLVDESGSYIYAIPGARVFREDVAKHFGNSLLERSGVRFSISVDNVIGKFDMYFGYLEHDDAFICQSLSINGVVN